MMKGWHMHIPFRIVDWQVEGLKGSTYSTIFEIFEIFNMSVKQPVQSSDSVKMTGQRMHKSYD